MGNLYSVTGTVTAVLADVFELVAPADAVVAIHYVHFGQTSLAGDANADMFGVRFESIADAYTSGSGGSSVTPQPLNPGAPAAGSAVEEFNGTLSTGGTRNTIWEMAFNAQVGFYFMPPPDGRPMVSPSDALIVKLYTSVPSSDMVATMIFEEIGG